MKPIGVVTLLLLFSSGCVVAGGYSSGGGMVHLAGRHRTAAGDSGFISAPAATVK